MTGTDCCTYHDTGGNTDGCGGDAAALRLRAADDGTVFEGTSIEVLCAMRDRAGWSSTEDIGLYVAWLGEGLGLTFPPEPGEHAPGMHAWGWAVLRMLIAKGLLEQALPTAPGRAL